MSFNPINDTLTADDGTQFKLEPPKIAPEVPEEGFKIAEGIYVPPSKDPDSVEVVIDEIVKDCKN